MHNPYRRASRARATASAKPETKEATHELRDLPARLAPYLQSLLRIVTGLLFLEHGTGKVLNFPAIPA